MKLHKCLLVMTVLMAFLFVISVPVEAGNWVEGKYDVMTEQWTWTLSSDYKITPAVKVGATLVCYAVDTIWKAGIVPSWVPDMQGYEVWVEADIGSLSVRLTDWCDHWLRQAHSSEVDRQGLTLAVRYHY